MFRRRHVRLLPLCAFFVLVLSTATASAECAWVLWSSVTGSLSDEESVSPVSAAETKQQCEVALAKQINQVKRVFAKSDLTIDELSGAPRVITTSKKADGSVIVSAFRYQCLPDTLDPRGPKGK
jgi:hypothetical protein